VDAAFLHHFNGSVVDRHVIESSHEHAKRKQEE
jgi:hypothetical protein